MSTLHIYSDFTCRPLSVLGMIIAVVGIIIAVIAYKDKWGLFLTKKERSIICGVAYGVCAIVFILSAATVKQTHLIYEVTIDESYPAVELYSKFEIVEKRGDIWVLEKRPEVKEEKDQNEDR